MKRILKDLYKNDNHLHYTLGEAGLNEWIKNHPVEGGTNGNHETGFHRHTDRQDVPNVFKESKGHNKAQ